MKVAFVSAIAALCFASCTAMTPLFQQVSQLLGMSSNELKNSGSCTRHGECYDMRLQNVKGCTDGWTLHGLWPQWGESCTHEKFDYSEIEDLASPLKEYWPSCEGSAQDFWEHEWSKHGTCSGMSQHDFFSTAIELCKKYRDQCSSLNSGGTCNICLTKDLSSTEQCASRNKPWKGRAYIQYVDDWTRVGTVAR